MIPLGILASAYVAQAGGPLLTFISAHPSIGSATVDFGTPSANRTIIVIAGFYQSGHPGMACTIGGVAATVDYSMVRDPYSMRMAVFRANVPTGTSGTVSITNTSTFGGFAVWVSDKSLTLVDADVSPTAYGIESVGTTVSTASGGMTLAHALSASVEGEGSAIWTNVTERYDMLYTHGGDTDTTGSDVSLSLLCWNSTFVAASYAPA